MRHPVDSTLRRLLDEPAGVPDPDREHVADCAVCRTGLESARADAQSAGRALDVVIDAAFPLGLEVELDVDGAWHRVTGALAEDERGGAAVLPARRRRLALRSPVVAGLGAVALLAGGSAAAANDWLQVFRAERVAPVAVAQSDLVDLPDLSAFGDLEVLSEPEVREVPDLVRAAEATGLAVPRLDVLPGGVTGLPTVQVGERVSVVFTFDAAQAARAAGGDAPPVPAGLDGSRFRITAGPGLAAVWSEARGLPALVVARAVAPAVESSGVPFPVARDYLLSLPGLPDDLAAQLRGLTGDASTLPLPVPAELVESEPAVVDGIPATVLRSSDGALSGVVWVQDGVLTAVAGSLSTDEVLAVARDLQ